MRFAIGVPTVLDYADPMLLIELARSAEGAGWDGLFLWDHLVYHGREDPVADPWTTLAAITSETRSLRLGVLVAALARRRPWKVARETATLDIISGGRLVFGAGLGSVDHGEFGAFGEDSDRRIRAEKVDEGLEIIAGLWTGEPFSFQGTHYRVEQTVFLPTPVQRPRIPIWVAGRWPNRAPFRRAARWDGMFPTHAEYGFDQLVPPGELRRIIDYTLGFRDAEAGPYDVVLQGITPLDRDRACEVVAPYGPVGLTWWVERIGWFRGTIQEMRSRIEAGPPRA